jgi:chromosome partitioning protein
MGATIAVLSQKGGTGKTTMVRSLTDVFERLGMDVLAIDADPQGNLSDYFDTPPDADPTLAEVLQGRTRAADAVHGRVIPANLTLAEAELMLAGKIGREVTLRNALRDLKRQKDMILIDCPPTLGLLTVNALVASPHAILSTEAQYFSLQGMEQANEVLDLARDSLNPDLELLGVCLNIANMRTRHARQTLELLRARFGERLFRSVIRQSIAYAEAAERAVPILDYRADRGADYLSLAGEILRRLSKHDLLARLDELSAELVPAGPEPAAAEPQPEAPAAEPRPAAEEAEPPEDEPAAEPEPAAEDEPGNVIHLDDVRASEAG